MAKSSLLYVIHNRSYSYSKNIREPEHCQVWDNKKDENDRNIFTLTNIYELMYKVNLMRYL